MNKTAWKSLVGYLLVMLVSLFGAGMVLKLWQGSLGTPFSYSGDAFADHHVDQRDDRQRRMVEQRLSLCSSWTVNS